MLLVTECAESQPVTYFVRAAGSSAKTGSVSTVLACQSTYVSLHAQARRAVRTNSHSCQRRAIQSFGLLSLRYTNTHASGVPFTS